MAATKVTLKLLIDQTGKKVLFAEAGKDFADFLFTLLALPVGTVVELLGAKNMAGSLGDLYESIENLSSTYMQPSQTTKSSVLKPRAPVSAALLPPLLPNTPCSSPPSRNFYRCSGQQGYSNCRIYIAEDPNSLCPQCRYAMNANATYVAPPTKASPKPSASSTSSGDEVGFVKGVVTYMAMDNLVVKPMSTISSITLLNKFQVKDLSSLKEKVVELGFDEGLELLRASLKSKTVLTDVFFNKK